MAITKIHAIKATVSGAINYICNEDKTDSSLLISYFGTTPKTAADDFKFTLSHTDSSDPNKAFHAFTVFILTPEALPYPVYEPHHMSISPLSAHREHLLQSLRAPWSWRILGVAFPFRGSSANVFRSSDMKFSKSIEGK